jgi:2-polyprenyl-6-methoxyphenol hydroxylase-like FAD-dependent oxidoreductase
VSASERWAAKFEFDKALTKFAQNEYGVEATVSNGEIIQADFMVGVRESFRKMANRQSLSDR